MLEGFLFVVLSTALIYISRASLRVPSSHGFYRFFAWEFLLVLFLLNMKRWFHDAFSFHQLISWPLLFISGILVIYSLYLLWFVGKPDEKRPDDVIYPIEKTTVLVTEGTFRYIRHPIYSSLLFLAWGIFFKDPSWLAGLLAAGATFFLVRTARVEEGENIRYFGEDYQEYMKRTRMFIPFLL
jgi:protein-S-isoprenylcysteine O-methyltransferase Ste14